MPEATREPSAGIKPLRPPPPTSVRALLFGAILLAGAPGVIFAAMQANHSYDTATTTEAAVRTEDAIRAAVRFDDALGAARDRVAAFAVGATVRDPAPNCSQTLAEILSTQSTYAFMGRIDASGRVNCGSNRNALGADFSKEPWFAALKAGAESTTSGISSTALSAEKSIVVAQWIRKMGSFDGAGIIAIPRSWFEQSLRRDLGPNSGGVAVFDHNGALIVAGARGPDLDDLVAVAAEALRAPDRRASDRGLLAELARGREGEFPVVSVGRQVRQVEITFRAALIVVAPILVSALSIIAVWLAMNRWVLRWFSRLRDAAQSFAAGAYRQPEMAGAPSEIATLASAFDSAVSQAKAREHDLASALDSKMSLTRELHHRVKNNLQVLSSLISRQQRRSGDPDVAATLGETRARMAPVVLAYRFINPPEERTAIDMHAYLSELARQVHAALNGDVQGVSLNVAIDNVGLSVDDASNLGLIIAEAMVTGYANAGENAVASLSCKQTGTIDVAIEVAAAGPRGARQLDKDLIAELARQVRGTAEFGEADQVTIRLPATAPQG